MQSVAMLSTESSSQKVIVTDGNKLYSAGMIKLNLEPLLAERGRSFYWLAKETGINQTMVSRMRHNKVKLVSLEALDRICVALACEPGELLVRTPDKKTKGKK